MKKKLNAMTVSGLMIGPILGSGIVFLPPLAYKELGASAILAWVLMMALGALFAYVFARITIIVPNNQGISVVVGEMLGLRPRRLSANYLTVAVLFGPIAVALTAADFLLPILPKAAWLTAPVLAAAVLFICALLVLSGAAFMGKFMLVLSTLTAGLLLFGSLGTLFQTPTLNIPRSLPGAWSFGHTLLLIFWSIIGWEVLGNFVEDVKNPARTIIHAMQISLSAIVLVYLVTAFALQNSAGTAMASLLAPLFGPSSAVIFALLAAGLCVCTIVTFTGAVARQTVSRLLAFRLPPLLQKSRTSVLLLLLGNLLVLGAHALGWLSFENIVEVADALFIGNAFLGLAGGFRLIKSVWVRIGIAILLLMLLAIFAFSPVYSILFFLLVTAVSLLPGTKRMKARNLQV
jgi:APA family basic amino acid/polyamine antiporter